jgi:arginine exporter protein ArgO
LNTLRAKPAATTSGPADDAGLRRAYLSILLLTLANPATILSFFAVFAGLGISTSGGGASAALALVAGVFLGSASWWLLLSFIAGLLRGHLTDGRMRIVNVIAGASILALGFWSLLPLFRR